MFTIAFSARGVWTFTSKRLDGSETRLRVKTPCKRVEDGRSLVEKPSSLKCVEDEL